MEPVFGVERVLQAKRAVFLDKEGLLANGETAHVEPVRKLAADAVDGLRALADDGFELIVVSNQPGVAFGHFPLGALGAVEERLRDLFLSHELKLTGCYWCPHHPDGTVEEYAFRCRCRKPMPALLQEAAYDHDLDLEHSWIVGHGASDVEAGRLAGCHSALVGLAADHAQPDVKGRDLLQVARRIVAESTRFPVHASRHAASGPYRLR
jgi:D-glycero-D-manno-heptose 1,7-bisphosphate phosphatase